MLVKINVCILLFSNAPSTLFLLLKNIFFSQSKERFSYWYSFKTLKTIDTAIYLWEIYLIVKQRRLICSKICSAHKVIKIILQEIREMEYTNMYL